MIEKEIIKGCIRGDLTAQKRLYELYAPSMMSVCRRYVCCRETARDLLHDGFIKIYAKIHTYNGYGSFVGWLKKVFVTTALDHLRRNDIIRHSVEIENFSYDIEDDAISIFELCSLNDLYDSIAKLPPKNRTVFNMHAIEGYSLIDIAKELNISDSTVRSRYATAKQLLQKMATKLDIKYEKFRKIVA